MLSISYNYFPKKTGSKKVAEKSQKVAKKSQKVAKKSFFFI